MAEKARFEAQVNKRSTEVSIDQNDFNDDTNTEISTLDEVFEDQVVPEYVLEGESNDWTFDNNFHEDTNMSLAMNKGDKGKRICWLLVRR